MDNFDYIESYFEGRCEEEERRQFEDRCSRGEAFAQDVALYVQTRQVLREELLTRKKAEWSAFAKKPASGERPISPRIPYRPLRNLYLASAAAAVLLIVFGLYLLFRPAGPSQLAAGYIHTHYDRLSQTMDGSTDSLQQGITAYNNHQYPQALDLFTGIIRVHPRQSDALLYSGVVYLRLKNYDQALTQFDTLAAIRELYSNPGLFLKAVTLLQRDATGDRVAARELLQEVVRRQLEGSAEAAAWLQKF
jgi:tetratricopeptide (TPR) repeat protein